jgi:hypothetical protein
MLLGMKAGVCAEAPTARAPDEQEVSAPMRRGRLIPLGEGGVSTQDACFALAIRACATHAAVRLPLVQLSSPGPRRRRPYFLLKAGV